MGSPDLKTRLLGKILFRQQEKIMSSIQELDFPGFRIPRHYMLTVVLERGGFLNQTQIEQLSEAFYQDSATGIIRPLSEVYEAADLLNNANKEFVTNDVVLTHTALRYEKDEMEQQPPGVWEKGSPLPGLVEELSGGGPARPLLLELYTLDSIGLAKCYTNRDGETEFNYTDQGRDYAMGLRVLYKFADWKGFDPLVVIGKDAQEVLPRTTQFEHHE